MSTTRSRTLPGLLTASGAWMTVYTRSRRISPPPVGQWSVWSAGATQFDSFYKNGKITANMTDVIGNRNGQNSCSHDVIENMEAPTQKAVSWSYVIGSYEYERTVTVNASPSMDLYGGCQHLTHPSTLLGLSASRVPLTSREDLNGIVNLAEMHETANAGATRLVIASARLAAAAWRKKSTARARKAFKKEMTDLAAGGYTGFMQRLVGAELEWKFGWKPLLRDLAVASNMFERVSKIQTKLRLGYRVHGLSSWTGSVDVVNQNVQFNSATVATAQVSYKKTTVVKCSSSVMRRMKSDYTGPDWQQAAAIYTDVLGLHPSLAKAWEIVPLSFVVDWAIPVGDMLESMEGLTAPQAHWLETYDAVQSTRRITSVEGSRTYKLVDTKCLYPYVTGGGSLKFETYVRSPGIQVMPSGPYIPPIQFNMNWGKWATGLELAFQRFAR